MTGGRVEVHNTFKIWRQLFVSPLLVLIPSITPSFWRMDGKNSKYHSQLPVLPISRILQQPWSMADIREPKPLLTLLNLPLPDAFGSVGIAVAFWRALPQWDVWEAGCFPASLLWWGEQEQQCLEACRTSRWIAGICCCSAEIFTVEVTFILCFFSLDCNSITASFPQPLHWI